MNLGEIISFAVLRGFRAGREQQRERHRTIDAAAWAIDDAVNDIEDVVIDDYNRALVAGQRQLDIMDVVIDDYGRALAAGQRQLDIIDPRTFDAHLEVFRGWAVRARPKLQAQLERISVAAADLMLLGGPEAGHRLAADYKRAIGMYLAATDAFIADGIDAGFAAMASAHLAWRDIQSRNGFLNDG